MMVKLDIDWSVIVMLLIVMVIIGGFAIGMVFVVHYVFHYLYAEPFKFNLTKQMIDEGRLLDICINTDIKIPNCNMITGKINSSYGEKLN